ncbi:glycosyltransferase family 9 protein [Candidatus Woesearchaeota archaeon]|nr:glycosyltransferase family 9 protein [Candidatus Woesearchaeota archaeon]
MDIDTMRRVDYWIGIPITFLLSILHAIGKLFGRRQALQPRKFMFIEISEMGSTILAYSSMSYIKKKYPGAQLYFLIFKKNRESIDMLKIVPPENVITISDKSFFAFTADTLKAVWRMRRERLDVSFDLELFSRFSTIMNYLSGAKTRVGFHNFTAEGLYRGSLQTHDVMYNAYYHMSQNFMALVKALEGPHEIPMLKMAIDKKDIKVPKIISEQREKDAIMKRLQSLNPAISKEKRIILLNPGASKLLPLREWPLHYYKEVAQKLVADKNTFVVVTGLKGDKEYAQAICSYAKNERCIDFTGMTYSLRELVDLYNISDMLITNDSGPAHFSALTNIRTIVFYGPETPALYGPLGNNYTALYSNFACSPCVSAYNHRKSPCTNNRCLQVITPETVLTLVKAHFARG